MVPRATKSSPSIPSSKTSDPRPAGSPTRASRPPAVQTYVLVSPVLGPLSYDWNLVFSDVQLSDLEHHGATTVPDDSESVRQQFTISKRTLADMSMVSGEDALRGLSVPVLITHEAVDRVLAASGSAHLPVLADVAAEWASRWVPVSR